MKKNKAKLLIGLVLVSLLTSGCGVAKLSNGQEAVVKIGDDLISVDDLYSEMKDKYALSVLLDMTDTKILEDLYKTDDEEEKYIKSQLEQVAYYYQAYYSTSYDSYAAFIYAQYGVDTDEALTEIIRLNYRRTLAVKDYAKSLVTDEEIKKYYDENIVPDIKASHILITSDYKDGATDEEKTAADAKALQTANDIIAKLKAGEDFATLAKTYSKDGSASNGGDLGWFNKGDMVSEFEKAAFALKVNAYTTTPVKTEYGYHIILKTEVKEEKATLEESKEAIVKTLSEEKTSADDKMNTKGLINLREEHKVSIEDSELARQYKNYIANNK